jgi:uncharacterized protein
MNASGIRRHAVAIFLALTFGITWPIGAAVLFAPDWFGAVFGAFNTRAPMFYLAVWAPNIAALAVTLLISGWSGITDLFARLIRWRVRPWVWIAALGFHPALMLVVELIGLAFGDPLPTTANWHALAAGVVYLPLIALGPLGEELGWRGFLLPRLLDQMKPLSAALILGAIWMVWHLPAFFMSGVPQSNMSLPIFMIGGIAFTVFITWLFLNARHSILIAGIIPHAIANAWGDAMGPMTWINAGVLVCGAVLLVWLVGLRDVSAFAESRGPRVGTPT